ncbi:hypothetical protein [Edaphobacter bradus]|uniref:hypothetical protein n=1 Tax=Edaphobacter bradus TaxID=2259016 RepID=UPI0021E07698|nr:hypothetical protein [Edaphobacter bradus]
MKRWAIIYGVLVSAAAARAQSYAPLNLPPSPLTIPLVSLSSDSTSDSLPDAPSASATRQTDVVIAAHHSFKTTGNAPGNCNLARSIQLIPYDVNQPGKVPPPCAELISPYQRFLDTEIVIPLTWQQKGYLAMHQFSDPSNLLTIVGISAINIGVDSHTAYGPGLKGWGKLTGVSLLQDATGEFFGAFAIPSLTHQDPRYYRMPKASIPRRLGHAVAQTYVAYSDDGRRMPNYGVILTYPIASEISNLYVPGIQSDGRSTAKRILIGYALEPVNNLVSEFVPDVARRVHVRIIFVQNILNNIAAAPAGPQP